MSTKLKEFRNGFLQFFAVFTTMFGLGYMSAEYLILFDESPQSASFSSTLMNAKMGKSLSFINVQLEPIEIPAGPNEIAEISGYITLLKSSNHTINYQWVLPEGVEIVEGSTMGQLDSVQVEQPVQVKIKISGYTKSEKKLLTLTASTMIGENSFSNVAILSSRPEDSHEYLAKQKFDADKFEKLNFSREKPTSELSFEEEIQR